MFRGDLILIDIVEYVDFHQVELRFYVDKNELCGHKPCLSGARAQGPGRAARGRAGSGQHVLQLCFHSNKDSFFVPQEQGSK